MSANRELAARFASQRFGMIQSQLRARGIADERLLAAFAAIPREDFVPGDLAADAYSDRPLPIGHGQTISQPFVVALMIAAARVEPTDSALEVGAGSGYAAAILGRIARSVTAIERVPQLAWEARERLACLGFDNVTIVEGDGTLGWPSGAPFDAIFAAASGPDVPQNLLDQLAPGGRLVMPLGAPGGLQELVRVRKSCDGSFDRDSLGAVRFVPLIGAEGWSES